MIDRRKKKGITDIEQSVLDKKKIIEGFLLRGLNVKAKNISQKELIKSIKNNEITICSGLAGTGKTYISLAIALELLKNRSNSFTSLYLVKSVTTLKGEEIGYLKGDLNEKIKPFIWSFRLNLEKILPDTNINSLFNEDIIRPFPLAYARGASIDNAIIIADEIQNISIENMRTLMTRIGENSKLVLLGDSNQVDLKRKEESSLDIILDMFEDVPNIGTIRMDDNDVNVRNPIIQVIENKFKERSE